MQRCMKDDEKVQKVERGVKAGDGVKMLVRRMQRGAKAGERCKEV